MKTYDLDFEGNSQLVASDNLKYKVGYFSMHLGGTSSRGILAYAGADWTPVYQTEKKDMPFEFLPVLTVTHPDGKELVLGENVAIDIFLAKQFGLHGNNAWEEALVNSFYSSSNCMFFQEVMNNFFWESSGKSDEVKKEYLDKFLNEQLEKFARTHEAHLENNHLNGHYVGNRTTLADIRTTTLLDATEKIFGKERIATIINETKTPGIIKVRKNVESKPSYLTWISSEEYKKLDEKTANFVKGQHPELFN
ncbi:hypothetical protein BGZ46_002706 [Entomortierella lignicola]|nr:hypothetical protein BGZ46_002706 [Entomortierella lignicola]